MCEVQELGAPGSGSHKGASPPPERLSVSSSGAEEDLKTPRDSLLSHPDESLKGEPPEGTSSSRKESGDIEASELSPETSRKTVDEEEKDDEEEVEGEKVEKETMGEDENVKEESESEAKDVKDCVCDESERENQENERRDELVENALKMEKDIKGDKTVDNSAEEEENRRGNDEAASKSDSPKAREPGKQEEDEEGKQNNDQEEKDNKDKHEVDEKKNKEREEKTEEEGEKRVDPFGPKDTTDAPITRKVSKTVNFLDNELKKHIENNLSKRNTINSTSSSSSFKSKEDEEEEDERDVNEDRIGGGELEEKNGRQWALGEGNPVYRLSMKLSPNLFNTTDIPGANQHKEAEKTGFLTKLSGRSFPYIAQWKRRYCVLSKGRLYYYEREDSKAGDKSNGVIQLEYFDQVAEAGPKECKKATNVFVITSQDRSFFDPGRHLFSADTLPDMKDWIRRLQAALDQIRNNNRPAASTSPSASPSTQDGGGKRRRDEAAESKDSKGSQTHIGSNKERKKKKEESGRARKSSRVGILNETQTSMVEPMTCEDGVRPAMAAPKGGVILPGFSSRKDLQATSRSVQRREDENEAEDGLPRAGPTLPSVTKQRVKGPPGRRAPQSHRRAAAAALKKRASSLSALEHQDVNDNRSESSEGATRSYRDSQTPEVDLKEETESEEENERKLKEETLYEEEQEVHDNSPERQFKIDNIDDGLFFKPGLKDVGAGLGDGSDRDSQRKRRTQGLKVLFEEDSSSSKNGTLGRLLRLRDSVTSPKRKKYETKEAPVADHPDMMINSRWRCVIL